MGLDPIVLELKAIPPLTNRRQHSQPPPARWLQCANGRLAMLRFTIREILLLTVIVAILVAWWIDHQRQAAEIRRLKDPWPGFQLDIF